jgi:putative NADH-flavin reductase
MKHTIKIAVLGGTGKSGKYLVKHLVSQGFQLKLLLRNPENVQVKNPDIEIVQGDARDYESVKLHLDGCQAVISALGQPKGEPSIFSEASIHVIRAMNHFNIRRYIVTTGLNVDTPFDKKSIKTKTATDWMYANYPKTTHDKQVEWDVLLDSGIDWTLVRLPLIEQTDQRFRTLVSLEDCPGDKISATDLAHFLIEQLTDTAYLRKAPFIANG